MKRTDMILCVAVLLCIWMLVPIAEIPAACRNPNVADGTTSWFRPVAASKFVEIKWFGHAFFQITSSSGTQIITDPFRNMGYTMPEVWPDVVTVGKETRNHSNVALAKGDPIILRGLKSWGSEWNVINTVVRDVLIYNVPIHMRATYDYIKGSAFVFEVDGLCICHTGDLEGPFNEDQLDLIGHIDVVHVPIGGSYTMGPESAKKVVEQLKPKIAVPMHYYDDKMVLERFLDGPHRARFLKTDAFSVSKDTLPAATEIFIPNVIWYGWEEDL
ncbi:MAG: MBL fold metallo-hydrolase [Desulfobacterales bacterium]|nr:MAG: MBL fold metallo-hydrolase [Desulfobacterales bacterium]